MATNGCKLCSTLRDTVVVILPGAIQLNFGVATEISKGLKVCW